MNSSPVAFTHPMWLAIGVLAFTAAFWLEGAAGGSPRRRLWRSLLVATTALALAGPRLIRRTAEETLLVVDASASVDASGRAAALAIIDPAARLPRLTFGDEASSPIGWALDRAVDRAAGGSILLLSDGQWTDPAAPAGPAPWRDLRLAAADAQGQGIRVDVLPLARRQVTGAVLIAADLVDRSRLGDPLAVTLVIAADVAQAAEIGLWSGARRLATKQLDLAPGRQSVTLLIGGLPLGPSVIQARLNPRGPGATESRLPLGVVVVPPPAVLVLGDREAAGAMARALSAGGLTTASGDWSDLSSRLSGLAPWDAVVLVDAPAERLGLDQLAALEAHVRERGAGLFLIAGPNSFDAGDWKDTVLERLSPLSLTVPPRSRRDPLSLTLLVDRSASMGSVEGRGRIPKIDLARDALLLATEALDPGDRVGVVAFAEVATWLLPPAVLGESRERSEIEAFLAGLTTEGGTGIGAALDLALPVVSAQTGVASRHVVLVTDGQDFSADRERLVGDVALARRSGITLSTIAVGAEADTALLQRLAAAGGGRFHAAVEPADLPALALAESQIIRARSEQRGSFRASPPPGPWQPFLAGVDVAALPPLAAYRSLAARTGLRPALQTSGGDPLLVSRPWGLGRVAAWASGVDEGWAPGWLASEAGRALWVGAVRQIARPPDATPPMTYSGPQSGGLRLGFLADPQSDDAAVSLRILDAEEGTPDLPLSQVAAGRFEALVPVPAGELWRAALYGGDGTGVIELLLAAPRSWELTPGPLRDDRLLADVAAAGGGRILTAEQARATLQTAGASPWPLPQLLLALLALFWTAEVAWLMRGGRVRRQVPERPQPSGPAPSGE